MTFRMIHECRTLKQMFDAIQIKQLRLADHRVGCDFPFATATIVVGMPENGVEFDCPNMPGYWQEIAITWTTYGKPTVTFIGADKKGRRVTRPAHMAVRKEIADKYYHHVWPCNFGVRQS